MYTTHACSCTFRARFACADGAYQQKFLHRSSVGSLLRVRCWLGRGTKISCVQRSFASLPQSSSALRDFSLGAENYQQEQSRHPKVVGKKVLSLLQKNTSCFLHSIPSFFMSLFNFVLLPRETGCEEDDGTSGQKKGGRREGGKGNSFLIFSRKRKKKQNSPPLPTNWCQMWQSLLPMHKSSFCSSSSSRGNGAARRDSSKVNNTDIVPLSLKLISSIS